MGSVDTNLLDYPNRTKGCRGLRLASGCHTGESVEVECQGVGEAAGRERRVIAGVCQEVRVALWKDKGCLISGRLATYMQAQLFK
jgi:hypothetical protein